MIDELQTMEIFLNDIFFPLSILSNSISQVITPTIDILSLAAVTQNRNTAMGAFEKMLSHIHARVLRDLIKIIRLEQVIFLIKYLIVKKINYSSMYFRIPKIIIYGVYVGV
jgi:hypothetical protein